METPKRLPCGCYEDACYCGQYPTREELDAMEAERQRGYEAAVFQPASCVRCGIANIYGAPFCAECRPDQYPTLAERLAESIKDDREF